jgi:hypothetical protein
MVNRDRRKHDRMKVKIQTKISQIGLESAVVGLTENLSQGGAFVNTKSWSNCQPNTQADVSFFLHPSSTGLDETVGLRGRALIVRVNQKEEGIGLTFAKDFRCFEWI